METTTDKCVMLSGSWYNITGQLHRTDGPAVELANGNKSWWVYGQHHRTDGPAVEFANGDKEWWIYGQRHRADGPAVEFAYGGINHGIKMVNVTEQMVQLLNLQMATSIGI